MADSKQFTAKIRAKGLDSTGVTEDHARNMAVSLGSHTLAIVDLKHAVTTTDENGNTQVALTIDQCEPVPAHLEDRVREFQRALYRQRPEVIGQTILKGADVGPTVDDALGDVTATIERDDTGNVVGIWDGNPDTELGEAVNADTGEVTAPGDPLPAAEGHVDPDETAPEVCAFPDCALAEDHAGDHADRAGHNLSEPAQA